jgi:hypothetical protein
VSKRLWTDRDQSLPAQARLVAKQFRCHCHCIKPASFAEPHASLRCVRQLSDLGSFPAYVDSSVSSGPSPTNSAPFLAAFLTLTLVAILL